MFLLFPPPGLTLAISSPVLLVPTIRDAEEHPFPSIAAHLSNSNLPFLILALSLKSYGRLQVPQTVFSPSSQISHLTFVCSSSTLPALLSKKELKTDGIMAKNK